MCNCTRLRTTDGILFVLSVNRSLKIHAPIPAVGRNGDVLPLLLVEKGTKGRLH